jgi:hypothetical protein
MVDARQRDWDVMASIGHELRHALAYMEMRIARMELVAIPGAPNPAIDSLKQYCASVTAK